MNVDPQEISKFNHSAWWDDNGPMTLLHQLNPTRLQFIQQHINLNDQAALDLGCGGGILTEALAEAGAITTGLDMSEEALNAANEHKGALNIRYHLDTAEAFAAEHAGAFNVITCMEMLEHVPEPDAIIKACSTLLAPGGTLFLSTLNRNPRAFFSAIVGAEYLLQLLPKGTHHYRSFIKPSELNAWADAEQLQLIDLTGISYAPLSRRFSLSQDVRVNYLACYQKPGSN